MKALAVSVQLGIGLVFGAALVRTGAADFDAMIRMFLLEEAHLFALGGATTAVAFIGLRVLLKSRWGAGVRALPRSVHRGSVPGGVVFGIGWGLSGTCPGTALAQLGSGHVVALITIAGVLAGNWLFERFAARRLGPAHDVCN